MKTVLVTGGAGFIGSHLSHALLAKGYKVRILDNLIYGNKNWLPTKAEFVLGDICDLNACREAMQEVEGVFHCAAMSRAGPSLEDIETCTQVNIHGTQNILTAARDANVKKVIYSGSSTFYGDQTSPNDESQPAGEFLNFYALTKQVGEQYCLLFNKAFGLPCIVLRYFNVYGPRQPEVGAYALVLGLFLRALSEERSLVIHGNGEQRRDFIHVKDVVNANILALESALSAEIFNVGSGVNISIKELANMISTDQVHTEKRPGDAQTTLADITKIKALLGWQPHISLASGIKELIDEEAVM